MSCIHKFFECFQEFFVAVVGLQHFANFFSAFVLFFRFVQLIELSSFSLVVQTITFSLTLKEKYLNDLMYVQKNLYFLIQWRDLLFLVTWLKFKC